MTYCPKHPQHGTWRRELYQLPGIGEVDTCAACGVPFDEDLREEYEAFLSNKTVIRRTILGWQRHVHAIARSKGYYSNESIFELLGNLMAEAAETWEEARKSDFDPKRVYYRADGKPEGLPIELADVVMRAYGTAEHLGIDLEAAINEKSAYNETRPAKHGGKRI